MRARGPHRRVRWPTLVGAILLGACGGSAVAADGGPPGRPDAASEDGGPEDGGVEAPPGCLEALTFERVGTLPRPMSMVRALVDGDVLHVFPGGYRGEHTDEVWSGRIEEDGTVGSFVRGEPYPHAHLAAGTPVRIGDRVFVLGGWSPEVAGGSNRLREVYSARRTASGALVEWLREPDLTSSREHAAAAIHADRLFVFGGFAADKSSANYTWESAPVLGGALGPFEPDAEPFATFATPLPGAAVVDGTLYAVTPGYWARPTSDDFSEWEEHRFDVGLEAATALVGAVGRTLVGVGLREARRIDVAEDGTLGAWRPIGELPAPAGAFSSSGTDVVLSPTHLYLMGAPYYGAEEPSDAIWAAALCP